MHRIFLLSPARSNGRRAALLFNERAQFKLAQRLRLRAGVPLGEVFTFLSGLYFRGKLAYAQRFANPPAQLPGTLVITSNQGLYDANKLITLRGLESFAATDIDPREMLYRKPLLRDARKLSATLDHGEVILLGSVASGKYADVLLEAFGDRLKFPTEFVGRGDMSRGGLLLRCAADGRELEYIPVRGAVRRGCRPPKLSPRRYPT